MMCINFLVHQRLISGHTYTRLLIMVCKDTIPWKTLVNVVFETIKKGNGMRKSIVYVYLPRNVTEWHENHREKIREPSSTTCSEDLFIVFSWQAFSMSSVQNLEEPNNGKQLVQDMYNCTFAFQISTFGTKTFKFFFLKQTVKTSSHCAGNTLIVHHICISCYFDRDSGTDTQKSGFLTPSLY